MASRPVSEAAGGEPVRVLTVQRTRKDDNPYIALLHRALERRGVEFVLLDGFDAATLERAAGTADVLHLHWLEHLTASRGNRLGRFARSHVRLLRACAAIRRAGRLDLRVVWTVHNLRPHERAYPWIDRAITREVLRNADALLVHSDYAAARVADALRPTCPVWVTPHGSYVDAYAPCALSRTAARRALGIPEEGRVFLGFGQIRAYKRLPEVVAAFRGVPNPDATLLIAGRPHSAEERAALVAAVGDDARVHLHLETVAAERVALYHAAADVAVLNYREVFSSGALLLALSQGLPVVAPEGGATSELLGDAAGFLHRDGELAQALAHAAAAPLDEHRSAALRIAQTCTWDRAAQQTLNAYRGVT